MDGRARSRGLTISWVPDIAKVVPPLELGRRKDGVPVNGAPFLEVAAIVATAVPASVLLARGRIEQVESSASSMVSAPEA